MSHPVKVDANMRYYADAADTNVLTNICDCAKTYIGSQLHFSSKITAKCGNKEYISCTMIYKHVPFYMVCI